jgi:hypothetical protein
LQGTGVWFAPSDAALPTPAHASSSSQALPA